MNSDLGKIVSIDISSLSFDSFERTGQDILCVAPVRTIVRREEEILIIRRVRKVEDVEVGSGCPLNTTQIGSSEVEPSEVHELTVYADARVQEIRDRDIYQLKDRGDFLRTLRDQNLLPYIANHESTSVTVEIENINGTWKYGNNEFSSSVGAEGNQSMELKERSEGDLLFNLGIPPAALVAFKIDDRDYRFDYQYVIHGDQLKQETIALEPGEKLYFIQNDQPGSYHDNADHLTVKWRTL